MAQINWHKLAQKDLVRKHGHEVVEREYTQKVRKSKSPSTNINLKQHETHDWQPIKGPFGPHAGKIICNTCGGKLVTWLPKGSI